MPKKCCTGSVIPTLSETPTNKISDIDYKTQKGQTPQGAWHVRLQQLTGLRFRLRCLRGLLQYFCETHLRMGEEQVPTWTQGSPVFWATTFRDGLERF